MKCKNDHEVQKDEKFCGVCGVELKIETQVQLNSLNVAEESKSSILSDLRKSEQKLTRTIDSLRTGNTIIYVLTILGALVLIIMGIDGTSECVETTLYGICVDYERNFDALTFSYGLASMLVGSLIYYLIKSWIAYLTYNIAKSHDSLN